MSDRPFWWRAVLVDVQFWVPFTVLFLGFVILRFVQ
jgi:hypothetical protein